MGARTSEGVGSIKGHLAAEVRMTRAAFRRTLGFMSEHQFQRPSGIKGWTNAELLFHASLGFVILPALISLARFGACFPPGLSRAYVAVLNVATPLFDRVNALAPHIGHRFMGRSLAARFDRVCAKVLRALDSIPEDELTACGMYYPTRWDPSVGSYVTLADLISSMSTHLHSHLQQLTDSTTE